MTDCQHDYDVIIIGAGIAGLTASKEIKKLGLTRIVLEASQRIGGRAKTIHHPILGGYPLDLGAAWLHKADHNPLVHMAQLSGISTYPFISKEWISTSNNQKILSEQRHNTYMALDHLKTLSDDTGSSLEDMVKRHIPNDEWTINSTAFTSSVEAAELSRLDFNDWRINCIDDNNLWVNGGLGNLIQQMFSTETDYVKFGWPVSHIEWGDSIKVSCEQGSITGKTCIITVSTSVLKRLNFTPNLPHDIKKAISMLPMGLLTKVAFKANHPELLSMAPDTFLERKLYQAHEPTMFFLNRIQGSDICIGLCGGQTAQNLVPLGTQAHEDFARTELAAIMGSKALSWIQNNSCVVSNWGNDPLYGGSYSHGLPGCGNAREILATPLNGGRLCIAGEACHQGAAGTVHGAMLSAYQAVNHVTDYLLVSKPNLRRFETPTHPMTTTIQDNTNGISNPNDENTVKGKDPGTETTNVPC
jgi:monoamine oxidase